MNQEILDYIKTQRICVLSVAMPDGSPHAASVHFAHGENPFEILIMTHLTTRKCEQLIAAGKTRASIVVGFDENNMKTLQLDGEAVMLKEDEDVERFSKIFFDKFNEKIIKDDSAMISFKPTWWRFTDWTKPEGKLILSSDNK